jgi:hypothetical protein
MPDLCFWAHRIAPQPLPQTILSGHQRFLPPEDIEIGSLELSKVAFVTLAGAQKDSRTTAFDGLLPTNLVRRVFIDHADHFAILEPW